jgi:hypothetical protein
MEAQFFGLGSIPQWETIYPSNFLEGTLNVLFSGFNFILNFLMLLKVSSRSEMTPSSSCLYDHVINVRFSVVPTLRI